MNVYNIKDINSLYEKIKIGNEIYKCSLGFSKDYPNFLEWYMKHLIESIITNNRTILYVKDNNNIIAFSLLKKKDEKKICTIFVNENYRNRKIGTKLLLESFKYLGTTKPLITIRDYKINFFKSIIEKYNWSMDEELVDYYGKNTKEYCFNKIRY